MQMPSMKHAPWQEYVTIQVKEKKGKNQAKSYEISLKWLDKDFRFHYIWTLVFSLPPRNTFACIGSPEISLFFVVAGRVWSGGMIKFADKLDALEIGAGR